MHIHWFNQTVFPDADSGKTPYALCRCGAKKLLGDPSRYFINEEGEWEYDDADYGPP